MRDMSERKEEYTAQGVAIVAVNSFEDRQAGRDWIASSGLDYHWAFADKATTDACGVNTVPTQIILDREGKVVWTSGIRSVFAGADAIFEALDNVL
jgi:hypothetical protein